jgi:hypothetical protein
MLKRSIFDILCDILYMQTLTNFIKIIISPLIYKLEPIGNFLY